MKIIQIMATDGGSIGGLEKHTFELCRSLSSKIEVHLFLDKHYQGQEKFLSNVHCHYFDFSKSRLSFGLLFSLYKTIKLLQPDLIHAQGGKAAKLLSILSYFINIPTVATIHGMKNNISGYKRFDQVIAVSQKIVDKISPYRSVALIYNGIAFPQLINENCEVASRNKGVAIGRLDPVKGFDKLIQAWEGIDAQLEIIGEGAERAQLEALISKLNLKDKVKLIGFSDNIYPIIAASTFVIISSHKEGGPLVVAEALLMQKPIIATNVGMVSEFIPKKYIVQNNTKHELHRLIVEAFEHQDDLKTDFQEAYKKARKQLSIEAMSDNTFTIYKQIVQNANI